MMFTKSAIAAQWFAAGSIAAWGWFYAQATTLDTAERLIGGSFIAAVSVTAVWITLRASASQRDSWTRLLKDERQTASDARDEARDMERQRDEWHAMYDDEHRLHMQAEERCREQGRN